MLWIFIAVILVVLTIFFAFDDPIIGAELVGVAFATGVLLSFAMNIAFMSSNVEEYQSKPHYLANLQDVSEINGSFFLGIGGIGEDMKYSFYGETSKGVYELMTVDNEDVKITFTEGKPYYTNTCYKDKTSKVLSVFSDSFCVDEFTFHVPEGTIKTQFKLDAK